jgi:hypothetical protein
MDHRASFNTAFVLLIIDRQPGRGAARVKDPERG